jgi:hypothetical protein
MIAVLVFAVIALALLWQDEPPTPPMDGGEW